MAYCRNTITVGYKLTASMYFPYTYTFTLEVVYQFYGFTM